MAAGDDRYTRLRHRVDELPRCSRDRVLQVSEMEIDPLSCDVRAAAGEDAADAQQVLLLALTAQPSKALDQEEATSPESR